MCETQPQRFESLFLPLIESVVSRVPQHEATGILGIALLDRNGNAIYEFGQLVGIFSESFESSGSFIVSRLLEPTQSNKSKESNSCFKVGLQQFIPWLQESHVRLYAVSRDGNWGFAVRKLNVGFHVAVVHARPLVAQRFLPEFERFCDSQDF